MNIETRDRLLGGWKPRLGILQTMPLDAEEWYALAKSDVYANSGIQGHLDTLRRLVNPGDVVVELGVGGGDQSTLAWLYAIPLVLHCCDTACPPIVEVIAELAAEQGTRFHFHCGSTTEIDPIESDILFVDTTHNAETVEIELARFAPLCKAKIVFHDVCSFGRQGQCGRPNNGINLAIAEFLFEHPEWVVESFYKHDNGLLVLRREHDA